MAKNPTPKPEQTDDTEAIVQAVTDLEHSESAQAVEKAIEQADLLAEMPALKPLSRLRMREQNRFTEVMLYVRPKMAQIAAEKGEGEVSEADLDQETVKTLLEVAAMVDEFAESIAIDKDAYVDWAVEQKADAFMALFYRFAEALGN